MLRLLANEAEDALALADRFAEDTIDRHAMRVMSLHALGREQASGESFGEILRRWPANQYEIASLHAWMGRPDPAFDHLGQAVKQALPQERFGAVNTLIDPRWRPYVADPRWRDFLEATHQTDEDLSRFDVDIAFLR